MKNMRQVKNGGNKGQAWNYFWGSNEFIRKKLVEA